MKRHIRIEGDFAYVPLTKGYEAIIDTVDAPLVEGANWFALVKVRSDGSIRSVYAVRSSKRENGKQSAIWMHRVIASTPFGMETDHRDGDGLNNRRSNLRTATIEQNRQNARLRIDNRSGAKGVTWSRKEKKWRATIKANKETKRLGYFSKLEDAAEAYAKASLRLHGDFNLIADLPAPTRKVDA